MAAVCYVQQLEAAYQHAFAAIETLVSAIERVQQLRRQERIWHQAHTLGVAPKRPEPLHVRAAFNPELAQLSRCRNGGNPDPTPVGHLKFAADCSHGLSSLRCVLELCLGWPDPVALTDRQTADADEYPRGQLPGRSLLGGFQGRDGEHQRQHDRPISVTVLGRMP